MSLESWNQAAQRIEKKKTSIQSVTCSWYNLTLILRETHRRYAVNSIEPQVYRKLAAAKWQTRTLPQKVKNTRTTNAVFATYRTLYHPLSCYMKLTWSTPADAVCARSPESVKHGLMPCIVARWMIIRDLATPWPQISHFVEYEPHCFSCSRFDLKGTMRSHHRHLTSRISHSYSDASKRWTMLTTFDSSTWKIYHLSSAGATSHRGHTHTFEIYGAVCRLCPKNSLRSNVMSI